MKRLLDVRRHQYFRQLVRKFARPAGQVKKPKTESKSDKALNEVIQHFSNCNVFKQELEFIPKKILNKKPKQPENLHLMDETVAKNIVDSIKNDIIGNGAPIFECNPGFGLITNGLLEAGATSIRLCEMDQFFNYYAQNLVTENPGRVSYFQTNFLQLWKITYQDIMDNGERLKGLMDGIEIKKWEGKPVLNLFSVLTTSTFLRHIVFSIIFQSGVIMYGRPELYVILPPNIFLQIREDKDCGRYQNRTFTTLCSLFFDCHLYGTIHRKAFVPWQTTTAKMKRMCQTYDLEMDRLYLVKLSPKKHLYSILPPNSVKLLWFFIKHHLNSRNSRIIPCMEQWVPGCGPRLISAGHGVFTQFSELTSQQILELFLEFINWPEFQSCAFIPAMESTTLKMVTPSDLEMSTEDSKADDEQSNASSD